MSDDVIFQFVDTNIFVYAYDTTAGAQHERAKLLLQQLWNARRGAISIQVLQEFYVNITRKIPFPLSNDTAKQIISDLQTWKVHSPTIADVLDAIGIQQRYQISFWDAFIVRSATQTGSDRSWSEDLNSGQVYGGVRVVNPFANAEGSL
jgi:predicted nucleic acid-binding protein